MKVTFLTKHYKPHVGGIEKHVEILSRILQERGIKIVIITNQQDGTPGRYYKTLSNKTVTIPHEFYDKKISTWNWIKDSKNIFQDTDIIHIHDVFWWCWPIFDTVMSKPTFITFHGYEGHGAPKKTAILQRKISELLCNGSICVGGFMKKWYLANPTITIYGASTKLTKSKKKKHRDCIYYGRLKQDVGIMAYLKSVEKLKRSGVDFSLDIFGDGPLLDKAKEYSKKHKLNVSFYGFQKNIDRKITSYKFAFTSRYLGIIEAMQVGVPIFAHYNNQIKKDYLTCHPQSHNFYIAPDAKTMAKQILEYQDLPKKEKQRRLKEAQEWAQEQTWDKLADDYLKLWQSKTNLDLSKYIKNP